MPHLIIEYSANLGGVVGEQLVDEVHRAALSAETVSLAGLRTRAVAREMFRVADGDPENAFVALTARLGPGRTSAQKNDLIELILVAAEQAVSTVAPEFVVSYSVEFQEIDAEFRINRNHIRARLEEKTNGH